MTSARANLPETELAPITRANSLSDDVYDAIFAQLMSLKIAPGARITVDSLVKIFNVSQTPIREALGRLEGEGLVVKTHLVGYRAAPQITRRRFDELYEMRLLLEPHAAACAVGSLDDAGLARLTEVAQAMAGVEAPDLRTRYAAFARHDADFHDVVLALAGNELIRQTLRFQHSHFHIFRLMFQVRVTEEALGEHTAILAAFLARDAGAASAAMRAHLENSRDRLLSAFE